MAALCPGQRRSELVWVWAWGLGAYGLGEAVAATLKTVGLALFGLFCIAVVAAWLYFRCHENGMEAWAEAALPGSLQPHRPQDLKPVG
jgi:hypothetical protein